MEHECIVVFLRCIQQTKESWSTSQNILVQRRITQSMSKINICMEIKQTWLKIRDPQFERFLKLSESRGINIYMCVHKYMYSKSKSKKIITQIFRKLLCFGKLLYFLRILNFSKIELARVTVDLTGISWELLRIGSLKGMTEIDCTQEQC